MPQEKRGTSIDPDPRERIGSTPDQQLRWILDFAHTDLGGKRPEERIALAKDLAAFPDVVRRDPAASVTWRTKADVKVDARKITDARLKSIRSELARGFQELMTGSGTWTLPGLKQVRLARTTATGASLTRIERVWEAEGDARIAVLSTVAGLLIYHGQKLRVCPECGKVFISNRRQSYCDTRCSQRVRNAKRYAEQLRQTLGDHQAERYLKQSRKARQPA
jgi:hypothetical protein